MRGVTGSVNYNVPTIYISTHTPHARRDFVIGVTRHNYIKFLLTRLMRGVTLSKWTNNRSVAFLLTRLMRGVTCSKQVFYFALVFLLTRLMRGVTIGGQNRVKSCSISTHTPHARRDKKTIYSHRRQKISTHTPHARRDSISALRRKEI